MPYSFEKVKDWVSEIGEKGEKYTVLAIVGNKKDLESQRSVPMSEALAFAHR